MTLQTELLPGAAIAAAPGGRPTRRPPVWRRREKVVALAAVAPAFLLVAGFMAYPVLFALYISLNKSNGLRYEWRGLQNYFDLLVDPLVHQVLLTNLKFIVSVPIIILVSLVCAVLLFERIRGWKAFRVIFFLPSVLSTAVIGLMFKTLFSYRGPVNELIIATGGQPIDFFANGNFALVVIIVAVVWSGFGYQTLILLSGLTSINPEIFEAAMVDGAGWWQRLWFITLPNIRGVLGFVSIINVLYTFTSLFGFVFVMTAGGPGYDTTTIDYLVFQKAFSTTNLGSGAALAVLLFLFIGILTLVQVRFFRNSGQDES